MNLKEAIVVLNNQIEELYKKIDVLQNAIEALQEVDEEENLEDVLVHLSE